MLDSLLYVLERLVVFLTGAFTLISAHPLFYPALAIATVLGAVTYGAFVVLTARPKAKSEVAELVAKLDSVNAKLMYAEEVGHIGSFTWDFVDPSQSFWSDEMYALFGMEPRSKTPEIEDVAPRIHEDDRAEATEAWKKIFVTPGDFSISFRSVAPNGQVRYLNVQGQAMRGPGSDVVAVTGVAHDVTKEMEVDRAKTEFVSLASHQLKTPLTSINWLSEALMNPKLGTLTEEQKKYVANIHNASQHMVDMVNDLLNVSRIELGTLALRIEEINACNIAEEVIGEQKHVSDEKGIRLEVSLDRTLPNLRCDKNLLRMVLQNLISNAIKYTPMGGMVTIELAQPSMASKGVFLRVADTGMGIPQAEQHKIFQRLYRAPNATASVPDGTGLGLYLVNMIIERVGGGISFDSQEGKGTTFYVTLPQDWSVNFAGKTLVRESLSGGDKGKRDRALRGILTGIWRSMTRGRS